jgi:signal transduction histidine kinase
VIGMFKLFAQLIAFHLNAVDQVATSAARLLDEQKSSELREQFIAVLGHDLRNPLAAISAGAELLLKTELTEKASRLVRLIHRGAARMSSLIDDVMDFARGRLGGGVALDRGVPVEMEPVLRHVVAELRTGYPGRTVDLTIMLDGPILCDKARIGQLLSNLLANALTHGAASAPVRVKAVTNKGWFVLSVCNEGEPIPASVMKRIFQPFSRGTAQPGEPGLGLGLFIASEIARAHGGMLDVQSSAEQTCFSFRMPLAPERSWIEA